MIIAKSSLLDRENAQEVEKFNKLIEDYYNLLFIIGDADLSEDESQNVENLMKGFRSMFRDKDMKVKVSRDTFKGKEFSSDITKLGEIVKSIKKK
tara:strand:+ start:2210 stop:2494 length:285 start_codon:yes stop_codon:yes gene_type:complete